MIDASLQRGEAVVLIGDLNRPIQCDRKSKGTTMLLDWVGQDKMSLLNFPYVSTRFDPRTKKGSTLDLCLVSKSLAGAVKNFEVDSLRNWSPFAITKKSDGSLVKKFSDHVAINVMIELPAATAQKKSSTEVIDYNKPGGWEEYARATNAAAHLIVETAEDLSLDINVAKKRIDAINLEVKRESFGVKWIKRGGPIKKKPKPKDPKQVKEIFTAECKALDDMINIGSSFGDVNKKMFKMRTLLNLRIMNRPV